MTTKQNTNAITIDATNLQSLADAVAAGVTTPELLADWIGVDLVEDCLVLEDSPIFADDGNAEIEFAHDTDTSDAANQYIEGGDWGDRTQTVYVTVHTYRKGVNDRGQIEQVERESHTITIEPDEPDCIDGNQHVWKSPLSLVGGCKENPGVYGHGGGVIITECCMLCGCKKQTDTWAQNPENGEQGLTSVEYTAGEWTDEVNIRLIKKAKDELDTNAEQSGEFDFIWEDAHGDLVGASDDDLREYGIALRLDADAPKITGTLCSAKSAD